MLGRLTKKAAAAAAVLLLGLGGAGAGPLSPAAPPSVERPGIVAVQYYAYPRYGYGRPYGPGPRYYNNHFGPGAAKERYITRRNFCRNKPEHC